MNAGLRQRLVFLALSVWIAGGPAALRSPAHAAPTADPVTGKVAMALRAPSRGAATRAEAEGAAPGSAEIDVRLTALTPSIVDAALAAGLRLIDADWRHARLHGTCPDADCIAAIAAIPEVTAVHPNYGAITMVGNALSQADVSIRAAAARQTFDVSGAGVRIGILSDTFTDETSATFNGNGCNRRATLTNPSAAAELASPVRVFEEPPQSFDGIDEGRAMAELVHDLAPGAELYFHTAFSTPIVFARGIEALADCGVDIIVDDVIYFAEPMFQDGIIAQAAEDAVERGVLFFSAIGNLGPWGVDEIYTDGNPDMDDMADTPSGADLHRFANGNTFASVVPRGCTLRMVLQWNEPFSGTLGPGATTDLDLYVCPTADPLSCKARNGSRDSQGCAVGSGGSSGDPIEILDLSGDRCDNGVCHVAVEHVCGNKDVRFRVVSFALGCNFPSNVQFDPMVFHKAQAYGHPVAAGVVSTAAVFYREIDSDGAHQPPADVINVQPYSSLGGDIPIYFGRDGSPLPGGPQLRPAPLLAGPDGTNTSFFGLRDDEPDGFRNFFGTSAAAPHAAAVAALMYEADPELTAAEALDILRATAIDVETAGPDLLSGSGLIDAVDALAETRLRQTGIPTATPTATQPPPPSPTPSATVTPTSPPTVTSTPSPTFSGGCPGDCDDDGGVSINELVTGVLINLGENQVGACASFDRNEDGRVAVNELVQATLAALLGCEQP